MNTDDLREEFKGTVSKCLMHTDVGYDYFTDDYVLWLEKQLLIHDVSNRLTEPTDKYEPIIIEMYKEHLVELYNFAYEQALKTGKVDELKEIDRKINGC